MRFERITDFNNKNFEMAFNLYTKSFPIYEQRKINDQKAVFIESEYHYDIILVEEEFVGIILYWENEAFIYIEHFAIRADLRGKRYGTQVLDCFKQKGKTLILEIDPPVDAVSIKRKDFYEKNDFVMNAYTHIHPPYRLGASGHELNIMSYPMMLGKETHNKFVVYLKDKVMFYTEQDDYNS